MIIKSTVTYSELLSMPCIMNFPGIYDNLNIFIVEKMFINENIYTLSLCKSEAPKNTFSFMLLKHKRKKPKIL